MSLWDDLIQEKLRSCASKEHKQHLQVVNIVQDRIKEKMLRPCDKVPTVLEVEPVIGRRPAALPATTRAVRDEQK